MDIQLNDLIAGLNPDPIVLLIGERRYPINELTVAEVMKLQTFGDLGDKDALEFVASLFGQQVPPSVEQLRASYAAGDGVPFPDRQRLVKEVTLLGSAVIVACTEVASSKKLTEAVESIRTKLATSSVNSPG